MPKKEADRPVVVDDEMSEDYGMDSGIGREAGGVKNGRRVAYKEEEIMAVAKSWVSVMKQPKTLRGYALWNAISECLRQKYNFERREEALRVMWAKLHKDCKLYATILNELYASGTADKWSKKKIDSVADDMFVRRSGKRSEGVVVSGDPFKYKKVLEYLQFEDVWVCACEKGRDNVVGVESGGHLADDDTDNNSEAQDVVVEELGEGCIVKQGNVVEEVKGGDMDNKNETAGVDVNVEDKDKGCDEVATEMRRMNDLVFEANRVQYILGYAHMRASVLSTVDKTHPKYEQLVNRVLDDCLRDDEVGFNIVFRKDK